MSPAFLGGAIGFLLGAIVGSFLATLVLRLPNGRSALTGRSQCDRCGRTLSALDLVPLASALALRGRCRSCGARIDPLHARIELISALCGAAALAISPGMAGLAVAVFGWFLIPLAFLDWRDFWLPNPLVLLLAVAGVVGGHLLGLAWIDQVVGGIVGFVSLFLIGQLYRTVRGREGLGQGDPKLLGAIGMWLGWQWLFPMLALAAFIGLAIALAAKRRAHDQVAFGTMLAIAAWPVALFKLL